MKKSILFVILALCLVLATACAGQDTPQPEDPAPVEQPAGAETNGPAESAVEPVTLVIGSGASSGTWYSMLSTLATYWDKLDCVEQISLTTTSGSNESASFFMNKETNVCTTTGQASTYARNGIAPFTEPWDGEFRCILYTSAQPQQFIVRPDSDMHYVSDLVGHKLGDGLVGSGISVANQEFWSHLDTISYEMLSSVEYLALSESISQLQNDKLDCALAMYSFPHASISALADTIGGVRLLSYTEEDANAIVEIVPYAFKCTIPAGTYVGQDEDVLTIADSGYVCISTDIPDEIVYEMAKIVHENWDELCSINALFKDWTFTWAFDGEPSIELADGARQYYEEVGLL